RTLAASSIAASARERGSPRAAPDRGWREGSRRRRSWVRPGRENSRTVTTAARAVSRLKRQQCGADRRRWDEINFAALGPHGDVWCPASEVRDTSRHPPDTNFGSKGAPASL